MSRRNDDRHIGCSEWRNQIPSLIDLPAGDEVRAVWERHAADCPQCRAVLDEESKFRELFVHLPDPGPAYLAGRVMTAVREARGARQLFRLRDLVWATTGVVAGVVLGFWIAGAVPSTSNRIQPGAVFEEALNQLPSGLDELISEIASEGEEVR